ncbi:MAG: hypothetical protein LC772_07320 [Chloroflexi bacterium]|nr:hypothetical protein [Chloroflexota bacterium]
MPTLILHTPHFPAGEQRKQSFDETVATGRGDRYAINGRLFEQLSPGDRVVVICKHHQRQAEGIIAQFIPIVKTRNGIQRYDVVMENLVVVPFSLGNVRLNRNGIAVI